MPIASRSVQPSPPDSSLYSRCHPVQADRLRDPKQQQQPVGGGDSGGGGGGGGLLPFPICLDPRQAEAGAEAAAATSREAGLSSRLFAVGAASAFSSPQHPPVLQVTPSFSFHSSLFQSLSSASSPPSSPPPPIAPSFLFPAFLEPPRTRSRSRSGFTMNQQQQPMHGMPHFLHHHHHHHQLQTPPPPHHHHLSPALRGPGVERNDNNPPEGARQPHSPPAGARRRVNSPTTSDYHHQHHHHIRSPAGHFPGMCDYTQTF